LNKNWIIEWKIIYYWIKNQIIDVLSLNIKLYNEFEW
jgi:hypothetical protein